jgi:hypothetical protein
MPRYRKLPENFRFMGAAFYPEEDCTTHDPRPPRWRPGVRVATHAMWTWTRKLERLERLGLASRTRTITAFEHGHRVRLGGEWIVDREAISLRLTPRRKASDAQRAAAARARGSPTSWQNLCTARNSTPGNDEPGSDSSR